MDTIGKQINALRNKKKLSVIDLAKKSNLSRRYIYQIENDEANITNETLIKILKSLNVEILLFENINLIGKDNELLANINLDGTIIEKDDITIKID